MSGPVAPATEAGGGPARWIPGLQAVATYRRSWLAKDLVAGLVLTTLLVPQGMAYAELAGLPPITGLYTTVLCLLGYAVFGPSRILVLGPDSSLGPMIAAVIIPIVGSGGDPAVAVGLASMLGADGRGDDDGGRRRQARLHRRPAVQADPDRLHERPRADHPGQPAAEAVRVLGRRRRADRRGGRFVRGLAAGDAVPAALAVGVFTLVVILVLQRWLPKVPAVLVAVVLARSPPPGCSISASTA